MQQRETFIDLYFTSILLFLKTGYQSNQSFQKWKNNDQNKKKISTYCFYLYFSSELSPEYMELEKSI